MRYDLYVGGPLGILNELVKAKSSFGLNSIFGSFFVEVAVVEIGVVFPPS